MLMKKLFVILYAGEVLATMLPSYSCLNSSYLLTHCFNCLQLLGPAYLPCPTCADVRSYSFKTSYLYSLYVILYEVNVN
jgi:hypothetical protein